MSDVSLQTGGSAYEVNPQAARRIQALTTAVSNAAERAPDPTNFGRDTELFQVTSAARDALVNMSLSAQGENAVGFNQATLDLVQDAATVFGRNIQDAARNQGEVGKVDYAADVMRSLISPPPPPPVALQPAPVTMPGQMPVADPLPMVPGGGIAPPPPSMIPGGELMPPSMNPIEALPPGEAIGIAQTLASQGYEGILGAIAILTTVANQMGGGATPGLLDTTALAGPGMGAVMPPAGGMGSIGGPPMTGAPGMGGVMPPEMPSAGGMGPIGGPPMTGAPMYGQQPDPMQGFTGAPSQISTGDDAALMSELYAGLVGTPPAEIGGADNGAMFDPWSNVIDSGQVGQEPGGYEWDFPEHDGLMPPQDPGVRTFEGRGLKDKLEADGGSMIVLDSGAIGYESGRGLGSQMGGNGEEVTFKADATAKSAEIELAFLYDSPADGNEAEKAFIDVMKDGEVVDTVEVDGTEGGSASVSIDQPFDELAFRTEGNTSDFALKSITTTDLPPPVETMLEGDDLMDKLVADGGPLTKSDGGAIGVGGSRGGMGDQTGGDETLTFDPGVALQGAEVELAYLYANPADGAPPEKAFIDVVKDGEVVDTVEVEGTEEGGATATIGQDFDKLVLRSEGDTSDFALKSITTTGEPVPTAEDLEQLRVENLTEVNELMANVGDWASLVEAANIPENQKQPIRGMATDILVDIAEAIKDGVVESSETEDLLPKVEEFVAAVTQTLVGG